MTQKTAETSMREFQLSDRDFHQLAGFINGYCGLKMPPAKKAMVEGRLRRRVRALGFPDITAYCSFLFRENGLSQEGDAIIDAVTTNKTDFFREPDHFHFLTQTVLPCLALKDRVGFAEPMQFWSAAGSVGAEAYSMAMVAADFAARHKGFRFSVLATDICSSALEQAARGIYPAEMIEPVPADMRQRYLMRSCDHALNQVRIVPELRRHVRFARLNLNDEIYPIPRSMHVALCRNVLIYFDKVMQEAVLSRICDCLLAGGFLFIGHSETVAGFSLPIRQVAPTIFIRL